MQLSINKAKMIYHAFFYATEPAFISDSHIVFGFKITQASLCRHLDDLFAYMVLWYDI